MNKYCVVCGRYIDEGTICDRCAEKYKGANSVEQTYMCEICGKATPISEQNVTEGELIVCNECKDRQVD